MASRIQRPDTAFPLSTGFKRPRKKSESHLAYLRRLPCLLAGPLCSGDVEACHLRFGLPSHGKPGTGGGEKPSDCYAVPLCHRHHNEGPEAQHSGNEQHWWKRHAINPVVVAGLLFCCSGDDEAGRLVCQNARLTAPSTGMVPDRSF